MPEVALAANAAEVIAAAKAARESSIEDVTVPGWSVTLQIAPASAPDFFAAEQIAKKATEQRGGAIGPDVASNIAWFNAGVISPKFTNQQTLDLLDADPSGFAKVATICRMKAEGIPWPLFCVQMWIGQIDNLEAQEAAGEVPEGAHRFWSAVVAAFDGYLSTTMNKVVDFKALGKALCADEIATVSDAAAVIEEALRTEETDRKNVFEGSTESGEPASAGPDEPLDS